MITLTIGKLAHAAGVGIETIRYYERRGIMPTPDRLASGYRVYNLESLQRLKFIKNAQTLGFTLQEARDLLMITNDPASDCSSVNQKALSKIEEVNQKLTLLNNIKKRLILLTEQCPADEQPLTECSIITHLYED